MLKHQVPTELLGFKSLKQVNLHDMHLDLWCGEQASILYTLYFLFSITPINLGIACPCSAGLNMVERVDMRSFSLLLDWLNDLWQALQ
jgi:hypothetical protein